MRLRRCPFIQLEAWRKLRLRQSTPFVVAFRQHNALGPTGPFGFASHAILLFALEKRKTLQLIMPQNKQQFTKTDIASGMQYLTL